MRARALAVLACCVWACGEPPARAGGSGLAAPRVVERPAVVVFWLAAGDTLPPGEAAAAYDDLTLAAEAVVEALASFDIALVPTHADTVYVEPPDHMRRAIPLVGFEYPFGYVLIDPVGVERVLPGVYGDAELLDEIRGYFHLPDDAGARTDRVAAD